MTHPVPFPTREQFLDWGLEACAGTDCKILINGPLTPNGRCVRCERRWRKRKPSGPSR